MNNISIYFKNIFIENKNKVLAVLTILIFLIHISLYFLGIRTLIINITEFILKRSISFDHWNGELVLYNNYILIFGIILLLIIFLNLDKIIIKLMTTHRDAYNQNNWVKILTIFLPWLTILLSFSIPNINNPDFWWDEIDQFWISKGQNPYSNPNTEIGSIFDIIKNNIDYNLDPGGFSLLLRFWTSISNHQIFLRILPLIFFILSMFIVTKIALMWYPNNLVSYFAGFILLISSLLKFYAFELRPYSMELFTTLLALYWSYQNRQILESKNTAIFAGISLALCMTSRYSSIFAVMVASLLILIKLIQKRPIKQKITNFILFVSPVIICGITIYLGMLKFQNPGTHPPQYVFKHMFSSGNYAQILFNRDAIMIYLSFFLLLVIQLFYTNKMREKFGIFINFTIILNIIFILCSFLGIYPWSFITKWDISTHALFIVALLPLIYHLLFHIRKSNSSSIGLQGIFTFVIITISFLFSFSYRYEGPGSIYMNFIDCGVFISEDSRVAGNRYAAPSIRYLFEYGPFKEKERIYQNMSIFGGGEISDFDYILVEHYIDETYEIIQKINKDKTWNLCSQNKYSRMYAHNK